MLCFLIFFILYTVSLSPFCIISILWSFGFRKNLIAVCVENDALNCPLANVKTITEKTLPPGAAGIKIIEANPDTKRLYDDLLSNYNRLIRPVINNTETLTVWLGLKLSQLIEMVWNHNIFDTQYSSFDKCITDIFLIYRIWKIKWWLPTSGWNR